MSRNSASANASAHATPVIRITQRVSDVDQSLRHWNAGPSQELIQAIEEVERAV